MAKKTPQVRKNVAKKAPAKPAPKPVAKPALKKVPIAAKAKVPVKPVPAPKPSAKIASPKAPAPKGKVEAVKPGQAAKAPVPAVDPKKSNRKGITIVDAKPAPKKGKEKMTTVAPASVGRLLDPKGPVRKPLIPSGPKAAQVRPLGMQGPEEDKPTIKAKTPFGKKELQHFRQILIRKRAELVGDVSQMESEALQGTSGSLSSLPQHMAEQGSDTYDQTLALDLAAADRKLIKEIDDAIARIDNGTFGICELTGKPIKAERLEELPWARYSIEAARELERRSMWA